MGIRKMTLIAGVLILLVGTGVLAADDRPIQLSFGNQMVGPEIKAMVRDGHAFVNLAFLNRALHIITAPNIESGDVFLQFGKLGIKLYRNNPVYYINGVSRSLPEAPFEKEGQFWLPLEFLIKLGLVVTGQDKQQINLDWGQSYLIEVGAVTYQNHPAILLLGSKELQPKDYLLADPDRLVVELPGTLPHDALDNRFDLNPALIKRVRLEKDTGLVRLVFDLNQKVGYRVIQEAGKRNQALLVFDSPPGDAPRGNPAPAASPAIRSIAWSEAGDAEMLEFATSGELNSAISFRNDPNLLTITFEGMQLEPSIWVPDIRSKFVRGMQLLTAKPGTVKIQLRLADKSGYTTAVSPDRHRLTVLFRPMVLIGKTILLDPGHGGEDEGAAGRQGTLEKENNLEIALRLKGLLEQAGAAVMLTRTDDYFIGLYERSYMANYLNADLFVSIHTNFHPDFAMHGIGVYYYPGHAGSGTLGRSVLDQITRTTGLASQGVIAEDFAVTRETQMPGILVETGFLSNMEEENIIKKPEFKSNAARGIYQGILQYFGPDAK